MSKFRCCRRSDKKKTTTLLVVDVERGADNWIISAELLLLSFGGVGAAVALSAVIFQPMPRLKLIWSRRFDASECKKYQLFKPRHPLLEFESKITQPHFHGPWPQLGLRTEDVQPF